MQTYPSEVINWTMNQLLPVHKLKPRPVNYWTYEKCLEDSKRFQSRNQWSRGNRGAFQSAWRSGWMDEMMPPGGRK